jgi:UPF0755 protein
VFPFIAILLVLLCAILATLAFLTVSINRQTVDLFGEPGPDVSGLQKEAYAVEMVLHASDLTNPVQPGAAKQDFEIRPGESAAVVAQDLARAGLITNEELFRTYLIYSGADTRLVAGKYQLSADMTPLEIAKALQNSTPGILTFGVLPGWRIEEIGASLPTSGLNIDPNEWIQNAHNLSLAPALQNELPASASLEGFLASGTYQFARESSAADLIAAMTARFQAEITPEMLAGYKAHGLSLYQAVTLASIIQREAVSEDEQPTMASVFYNRISSDMQFESDPTVQYALGYNTTTHTWWTNPLSAQDLQVNSPYNTYLHKGFPPGPISNPGISALKAVASPAQTSYYYFRAKCDGSGKHVFTETYAEHVQNACP